MKITSTNFVFLVKEDNEQIICRVDKMDYPNNELAREKAELINKELKM